MWTLRLALAMVLGSGLLALGACSGLSGQRPSSAGSASGHSALVGGTVWVSPTEPPIHDGVILVRDGRIAAVGSRASVEVPQTAEVLDCSGLTVTAGFWNSHVHLFERKWADAATIPGPELARQLRDTLTRFGFTSVFDTGSMWENTRRLRDRIESGEVPGPRILSTGEALVAPGAMPSESVLAALGFMTFRAPEIEDEADAAAASRELLVRGVDGIKVHLRRPPPPNPSFPESAIRAAVREARRSGKPVFVHPDSGADVLAAVRSGVDVVAHTTPGSGPWDETILAAMQERRVALTPTLALWRSLERHDPDSARELTETAVSQLRAFVESGGTVLFGTDLGAVDYDPAEEYALMAEAGMSFRQILASLTTAPAERFGASGQLGRIAPGLQADLVVLNEDPAENVRALADVRYTLRAGRLIHRAGE